MIASRLLPRALAVTLTLVTLSLVSIVRAEEELLGAEVPFLSIDPSQTGAQLQVNFPPRANGDPNRLLYRIDGREDLEVDLQVFAGHDEVGFPIGLFVSVLVDGKQAKFGLRGAGESMKHALTLPSPGTVVHSSLSLLGERLSPGLHSIDLLLWRADGVPFPCWSFLALKGAPRTLRRPSNAFLRSSVGTRPAADFRLSSGTEPLFGPVRQVSASALASLSLSAHLERPPRDRELLELGVVALLDGTQVSFRGSGKCPEVELGPGQAADAELAISALPAQSTGHRLLFFLLRRPSPENLSAFLELQFSPTRQIGGVKW
jgi:hypothetical protein